MYFRRPSVFRWFDFLTFGGVALAVTVFAVIVQCTKQTFEAYALMWVTSAGFWFVYAMLLVYRAKWLAGFKYITSQGVMINPGEMVHDRLDFQDEVQRTINLYRDPKLEELDYDPADILAPKKKFTGDQYIFVTFKPGPIPHPTYWGAKVWGFVQLGGSHAVVGWRTKDQPLDTTAMAHELGHIILCAEFGANTYKPGQHHDYMKLHGLP